MISGGWVYRIRADAVYTSAPPGSEGNATTYTPDILNTRVVFKHILIDARRSVTTSSSLGCRDDVAH